MQYILTGAEMAACDARTSEIIGIPSLVLMERAALSVADGAEAYLKKTGRAGSVLAFAGKGNNGADALAAGRILLERGYDVAFCRLSGRIAPDSSFAVQEKILAHYGKKAEVFHAKMPVSAVDIDGKKMEFFHQDPKEIPASAAAVGKSVGTGSLSLPVSAPSVIIDGLFGTGLSRSLASAPSVIIDGLFGTGLSRPLTGEAALAVQTINSLREKQGAYVIAVDIPSGISSDDGSVMGCAVSCDETRTFAFYKRGHFLYPGASYAGKCHLAQIGITPVSFAGRPGMFAMSGEVPSDLLPARDPNGNKGTFGKVLIAAGRRGMCGAALLAAQACMASGAGMVKLFTHEANRVIVQQMLPEALLETWTEEEAAEEISYKLRCALDWADVAAAGPGMGTDEAAGRILECILDYAGKEYAGKENAGKRDAGNIGPGDQGAEEKLLKGEKCIEDHIAWNKAKEEKGNRHQKAGEKAGRSLRGLVLDADAIRLLAGSSCLREKLAARRKDIPCILTPHLAEFAALTQTNVKELKECVKERIRILQDQACFLRCTIVCKDARTLAAMPWNASRKISTDCGGNTLTAIPGDAHCCDYENAGHSPSCEKKTDAKEIGSREIEKAEGILYLNTNGNSGMATAGSGDVLTGMTAAILAAFTSGTAYERHTWRDIPDAGLHGFDAACTAVWLHGRAGDAAKKKHGMQGMTARDLIEAIRDSSFWE